MISALIHSRARHDAFLPLYNGYLLHSALSRQCRTSPLSAVFHSDGDLRFSCSPLMPEAFWKMHGRYALPARFSVKKGECFSFRAGFADENQYEALLVQMKGGELSLAGAGFSGNATSEVLSCVASGELYGPENVSGAIMDFLLPVGFKSEGQQKIFPIPELLFNSLAARWKGWTKEDFSLGREVFQKIRVSAYKLESTAVRLKENLIFRGSMGTVEYEFGNLPSETRRDLARLAVFASFCGVGYKVSQGMGVVNVRLKQDRRSGKGEGHCEER